MLNANQAVSVWGEEPHEGFTLSDNACEPSGAVVTSVNYAMLLRYEPAQPTGKAMLVFSGGGYTQLMVGREGIAVAKWLNGLGYSAFVLIHTFPDAAHGPSAALDDAIEAMRMIRANGWARDGLGVVGLSSGGHLAACLAASYPVAWPAPASRFPDQSSRPDILVVGYAPISTNAKGRTIIADKPPLPPVEKQAMYDALQPDAMMVGSPPPTFIVYSDSDDVVPVENAYRLRDAVKAHGGTVELHVFSDAPHGFALDTPSGPVTLWPQLCAAWLRQVGF
ncbi:esterase [Sphingomonas sp. Leaf67]|uniref:alpha/beta hydrolase n=1 Tax=Sphingomonas sp. Leaf67 TaxID=1736230 RepID=UPI0006F5F492|nr:alpha/beta hydrolase [Sphingomonas sp. Leaf67]KQN92134.1 esterase [Sphingomonas sp. Leaf67]